MSSRRTDSGQEPTLAGFGRLRGGFRGFGATMWSRLTIGWQWSEPDTVATTVAVVMTIAFVAVRLAARTARLRAVRTR